MLKRITGSILFSILISSYFSQTTLEEYNYITKGYAIQISSGLDMKKGYELYDHESVVAGVRTVDIKVLKRTESSETAAFMLVYQKGSNPKEYLCVPHPSSDPEVINKFWNSLYDGGDSNQNSRLQLITMSLTYTMNWYCGW